MSRRRVGFGTRFYLADLRADLEAERAAEEQQTVESPAVRYDPAVLAELQAIERKENKRRWASQETLNLTPSRPETLSGAGRATQYERAFSGCRDIVTASMRTVRRVRTQRDEAFFFASVALAAPVETRLNALVRAERFSRHLANLLGSSDRLLRSMETHEALCRSVRKEVRRGWVSPMTLMPSGLQFRFDETRDAVADAYGRAEDAIHAACADIATTPSFVSRANLKRYLWKNSESVLHRRSSLRMIFSAMPSAEGLNWLHEVSSCLTETPADRSSRVAIGFVLAAPRTIATAWAMSRRRAQAAVTAER